MTIEDAYSSLHLVMCHLGLTCFFTLRPVSPEFAMILNYFEFLMSLGIDFLPSFLVIASQQLLIYVSLPNYALYSLHVGI